MGSYDYYHPYPQIICPLCGEVIDNWHGKTGPCLFYHWYPNNAQPFHEVVKKNQPTLEPVFEQWNYKKDFVISKFCSNWHYVDCLCKTELGVWVDTCIIHVSSFNHSPDFAVQLPGNYILWGAMDDELAISKSVCTADSLRISPKIDSLYWNEHVIVARTHPIVKRYIEDVEKHIIHEKNEEDLLVQVPLYPLVNKTIVNENMDQYWLILVANDELFGPCSEQEFSS